MLRSLLALSISLALSPLTLAAQTPTISKPRRLWVEYDFARPHTSLSAGQSSQMKDAGYGFSQNLEPTCEFYETTCPTAMGVYYPQAVDPKSGTSVSLGYNATTRLAISGGHSFVNLGGATGLRKDASNTSSYVNSRWDSQAYWIMPSWRPVSRIRIGAGPAYYSIRERESATEVNKIGLHGEAVFETGITGPVFLSFAYKLDRAGSATAMNPNLLLHANVNYSSLTAGFGLRVFR